MTRHAQRAEQPANKNEVHLKNIRCAFLYQFIIDIMMEPILLYLHRYRNDPLRPHCISRDDTVAVPSACCGKAGRKAFFYTLKIHCKSAVDIIGSYDQEPYRIACEIKKPFCVFSDFIRFRKRICRLKFPATAFL